MAGLVRCFEAVTLALASLLEAARKKPSATPLQARIASNRGSPTDSHSGGMSGGIGNSGGGERPSLSVRPSMLEEAWEGLEGWAAVDVASADDLLPAVILLLLQASPSPPHCTSIPHFSLLLLRFAVCSLTPPFDSK